MRVRLTYSLLMAIGQDAANRSMRKAHREAWNEDDWNASVDAVDKHINSYARAAGMTYEQAAFAIQQTRGQSCIFE